MCDAYGRRSTIFLGNISTVICRTLMFLNPTAVWPIVVEQLAVTPMITSFFTTWRAAVSDELEGAMYAKANAKIGVSAGLGIIVGPLFAGLVMKRADPKWCFLVSVACSMTCLAHLYRSFEETLPEAKRKPMKLDDMQPLSFLNIMRKNALLRKLMLITGLQTTSEGRNINDTFLVYMREDLKWDWGQVNRFVGGLGVSLVFSGLLVKKMINTLGLRAFTTFSNACNGLAMFAFSNSWMWLGLMLAAPGARKRDAVEAIIMKRGKEAGFGGGFISGSLMNWRAVINVVGPVLFGSCYVFGRSRGQPGLAFLVATATVAAAQGVLSTLSSTDLGLDEHGFLKDGGGPTPTATTATVAETATAKEPAAVAENRSG